MNASNRPVVSLGAEESGRTTEEPKLSSFLRLAPPTRPEKAPAIVQFTRSRALNVPWKNLGVDDADDPSAKLSAYFEAGWRRAGYEYEKHFSTLGGKAWKNTTIWRRGDQLDNQHVLVHWPSGRLYLLVGPDGAARSFDPSKGYESVWGDDVVAFEQVFSRQGDHQQFASHAKYVSREILLIRDEYQQIKAFETFAAALKDIATTKLSKDEVRNAWWENPEQADADLLKFTSFATRHARALELKRRLAERAASLGFHLALETRTIKRPDTGQQTTIQEGEIYRTTETVVHWTTSDTVYYTVVEYDCLGNPTYRRVPRLQTHHHRAQITLWEKIVPTQDPVEERIHQLEQAGKKVFVARHTNLGWLAEDGTRLREVLDRCDRDEQFRQNCVVVIPDYDQFVSGKQQYLGAHFFYFPLPGSRPTQFPRPAIREHLSYTTMWTGTEIGQLVSSVSLAPGEERTISVSSAFAEEVTSTASFRSTQEASESNSVDLATEMQRELGREASESKTTSASIGGGFALGPFSANASASTSSTSSLSSYAKDMSRVARRAVQNINRKMSQEISSTSAKKTSVSSQSSRTITVRNINQGRTLNLLFYQINNIFKGGLFLRDIEIEVIESTELIAGTGIHDTVVYRRTELLQLLKHFMPAQLPVRVPIDEEKPFENEKYWRTLLTVLIDVLSREYELVQVDEDEFRTNYFSSANILRFEPPDRAVQQTVQESGEVERRVQRGNDNERRPVLNWKKIHELRKQGLRDWFSSLSKETLELADGGSSLQANSKAEGKQTSDGNETGLGAEFDKLREVLASLVILEHPLAPDDLIVASGGLYVDALVGEMPATELYSEQMRDLERRKVEVSIESEQLKARSLYADPRVYITSIDIKPDTKAVCLVLSGSVAAPADWGVYFKGAHLEKSNEKTAFSADMRRFYFDWKDGPLPSAADLEEFLTLENRKLSQRIFFLRATSR